jgi:histidine triad (HIT) family protein
LTAVDVLIIPKIKISQLSKATKEHKELLGHLMLVANEVAESLQIKDSGFRVVINDGKQGCKN